MLRSLKELIGYQLASQDNEKQGKVRDFLLEDREWTLRYLVSDVGGWLLGRRVLVPAGKLKKAEYKKRWVVVSLDEEQIESRPPISADEPVSKQHLVKEYRKRGQGRYQLEKVGTSGDPHLRSFRELMGYRVESREGEVGRVVDLIYSDETNRVCCLVVRIRGRLYGKKVLVVTRNVDRVDLGRRRVVVDLHRKEIKERIPYHPAAPVNRLGGNEIFDYLGRRR
jgi:uncharacterized protein YrrD